MLLSKEDERKARIQNAVLKVLRKEGFGEIRKEMQELSTLREESDESVRALARAIPRLTSTLQPLA